MLFTPIRVDRKFHLYADLKKLEKLSIFILRPRGVIWRVLIRPPTGEGQIIPSQSLSEKLCPATPSRDPAAAGRKVALMARWNKMPS